MTGKKPAYMHPNIRRIWRDTYRVFVAQGDIRSIEEQLERPELLSGDRKIDEVQMRQPVPIWITIDDMVEYFRHGVAMRLSDVNKAVDIFDALMDHVGVWRRVVETELNIDDAPLDDLITMEEFAVGVFELAKYRILDSEGKQNVIKRIAEAQGLGSMRMLPTIISDKKSKPAPLEAVKISVKQTTYEPSIGAFQRAMIAKMNNGVGFD